jgi:hypothetical protein
VIEDRSEDFQRPTSGGEEGCVNDPFIPASSKFHFQLMLSVFRWRRMSLVDWDTFRYILHVPDGWNTRFLTRVSRMQAKCLSGFRIRLDYALVYAGMLGALGTPRGCAAGLLRLHAGLELAVVGALDWSSTAFGFVHKSDPREPS